MRFWPNFFGSFYNPNVYGNARLAATGWGIRYSLQLLLLCGSATLLYLLATTQYTTPTLRDAESVGIIFCGMAILRAAILIPLVIACCLLGYAFKLRLGYAQGARLAALAYTPVAIADTVAFNVAQYGIAPPYLFGLGIVMLLAALYAAK